MANPFKRVLRGVDLAQQRKPVLAFPYAVVKKFGDDQAGMLAALIAYYGARWITPPRRLPVSRRERSPSAQQRGGS